MSWVKISKWLQDLFDDYLEMFIQLGYVVFFSSMFPLAALCAFANNMFEIRVDGFKITHSYKRPFGKTAAGIGVWQVCLSPISHLSTPKRFGFKIFYYLKLPKMHIKVYEWKPCVSSFGKRSLSSKEGYYELVLFSLQVSQILGNFMLWRNIWKEVQFLAS